MVNPMNGFVLSIKSHVTVFDSEINVVKHHFEGPISVFKFKFLRIGNQFALKLLGFFKFFIKVKATEVLLHVESFIAFNR